MVEEVGICFWEGDGGKRGDEGKNERACIVNVTGHVMSVGKWMLHPIDLSMVSWTEIEAQRKVFGEIFDFAVQNKFWSGGARLIHSCYQLILTDQV